jgi:hypothetical protein
MEKERRFLEDQARGGTMAFLRKLAREDVHLAELVASPERFRAHFARRVEGPVLDGSTWDGAAILADGSTVVLPAGVHRWDAQTYQHRDSFPKDILFRGAGMDRTLLVINEIATRQEIHSLTFEDLTIDCSNDYFSDLRRDSPVTIRMARCRVVGFDMGAGGSVMLAARTAAFLAEDCRFEAGFSRAPPGFGNLFRVRSGLLVRMERCAVVGPFCSVYDAGGKATYHFASCAFLEMEPRLKRAFEEPGQGVRLEGCTVSYTDTKHSERKRRPLKTINPTWP